MDPLTLAAIMGGVQMVSNAGKEKRSKQLAAATQRYSPWTKLQAGEVDYADPAGTAMQAVGAGLAQQQAAEDRALQKDLLKAQTGYFNRQSGPYSMMDANYFQGQLNSPPGTR